MAHHLLDETIADRDPAGNGEMGDDGTRDSEEAEKAGPPAVNLGDAPHQTYSLCRDENHVEQSAWAQSCDERHALGRGSDFALRGSIERDNERAFGNVDEIAAVDDFIAELR